MTNNRAILFDLDGVLVQTEELKGEAHTTTIKYFGGNVPSSLYQRLMGQHHEAIVKAYSLAGRVIVDPQVYTKKFQAVYEELLRTELKVTSGATELVRHLFEMGYILAVVSSVWEKTLIDILERVELIGFFNTYVSADDVENKKPAPDSYLLALERLHIPASSSVAIEDSETGVRAAINADICALALRHAFNGTHDFSLAYGVLDSLDDTAAVLKAIESALNKYPIGL